MNHWLHRFTRKMLYSFANTGISLVSISSKFIARLILCRLPGARERLVRENEDGFRHLCDRQRTVGELC